MEQRYADDAEASGGGQPVTRPRRGTVSGRAGDIREVEVASAQGAASASSASNAARRSASSVASGTAESVSATPKKRVVRVRKKRLRKKSSALDTPLSGSAPASKYEYYYEDVVVTDTPTSESSKEPVAQARPPAQESPKAEPPVQEARVTTPPKSDPGPQQPYPSQETAQTEQPKKETPKERRRRIKAEETEQKRVAAAAAAAEKEAAAIAAADTRRAQDLDHAPAHTPTQIAQVPAGMITPMTPGGAARPPSTSAYDESSLPDIGDAIHENERDARKGGKPAQRGKSKSTSGADAWKPKPVPPPPPVKEVPPPPPPVEQAPPPPAPSVEEVPPSKRSLESDAWKPKPTKEVALPGEAVDLPPPPPKTEKPKPAPEEDIDLSAAQKAAAKMESDQWTPKPAPATPSDAELGITNLEDISGKRAGRPKKVSDDMAGMSDAVKSGGQVGEGSEAWEPKSTSQKLSAKEEQQLAMANNLKPNVGASRPVKVNRDVNNPEEGVLPFYSLEKYSGAQYGRHREFERKVIYKQNKKSPVKGYDFYIDEVDRKQEKHYLYYYKLDPKTKKSKLIATEKHEQVTFLGNYDIGSEDKGKIKYE
jgi:hypothetical protein